MAERHYFDIVIVKEKLSAGEPVFVAHCTTLGISSQGSTMEEATKNVKEAITLYLEEFPDELHELGSESPPTFSFIEVSHNGKAASRIRQ